MSDVHTIARELGRESDYVRLFESPEVPYIISSLFLAHYRSLRVVAAQAPGAWRTYLPRDVETRTRVVGRALYGSAEKYTQFSQEFQRYLSSSSETLAETLSQDVLSAEDIGAFLSLIAEHWKHYQKMEFFFVDGVAEEREANPVVRANLNLVEALKFQGRAELNRRILGNESLLAQLIGKLARQHAVAPGALWMYSQEELVSLAHGRAVDPDTIAVRRESYLMIGRDPVTLTLDGTAARALITSFQEQAVRTDTLRGQPANGGSVRGKAHVIMVNFSNFALARRAMETMPRGAILVADTTSPELLGACEKASAILTNQGGLLSHAAIVSRELGIPCIVGLGNATSVLHDGDEVEVDADHGIVRVITRAS